jgi:hypothetical protein
MKRPCAVGQKERNRDVCEGCFPWQCPCARQSCSTLNSRDVALCAMVRSLPDQRVSSRVDGYGTMQQAWLIVTEVGAGTTQPSAALL